MSDRHDEHDERTDPQRTSGDGERAEHEVRGTADAHAGREAPPTTGGGHHAEREQGASPDAHADRGHGMVGMHTGHDMSGHGGHDMAGMHTGHDMSGHGGHDMAGMHGGHAHHVAQFRRLFWIMLVIAVPVVAFSPMFASLIGYSLPHDGPVTWISPVLGTVMFVWGGRPFLTGAWQEIRARAPGMMLLIGLAITVAFVASWGASLGLLDHELDFWWELALLVVIMLLGHWIEMRAIMQSSSALDSLASLLPDTAERVEGDRIVEVAPDALRVGDVVVVRPGATVPADGRIVDGRADLDESIVTGESVPVERGVGDRVVAGTVATDSGLRVEVTATGDDTALAGIRRLVAEAQSSPSRAQRLADTAAGWLFWFALGSAVVTAIVWSLVGSPTTRSCARSPCS